MVLLRFLVNEKRPPHHIKVRIIIGNHVKLHWLKVPRKEKLVNYIRVKPDIERKLLIIKQ